MRVILVLIFTVMRVGARVMGGSITCLIVSGKSPALNLTTQATQSTMPSTTPPPPPPPPSGPKTTPIKGQLDQQLPSIGPNLEHRTIAALHRHKDNYRSVDVHGFSSIKDVEAKFSKEDGVEVSHHEGCEELVRILNKYALFCGVDVVFVAKENTPPLSDEGHMSRPDVWGVTKNLEGYKRVAWDFILAAAEYKPSGDTVHDGLLQAFRYCQLLQHYRPHITEAHVLFANNKHYYVCSQYSDSVTVSQGMLWSDLRLLSWFMYQIKHSVDNRDVDLQPILTKDPDVFRQPYNITIGGKSYHGVPIQRGVTSRKSFVAVMQPCGRDGGKGLNAVAKIENRGSGRNRSEVEILAKLKGIPGVAQIMEGSVKEVAIPPPPFSKHTKPRTRTSFATADIGNPLCTCKSLLEVLKCFFDLVESSRWQIRERNILHRDPSWSNCLVSPEDYCPTRGATQSSFIEDLLGTGS